MNLLTQCQQSATSTGVVTGIGQPGDRPRCPVAARSDPVDAESDVRDTLEHVVLATRDKLRAERKDRKLIDRAKGLKLAEVALRMPDVVATRLPG